MAEFHLRRVGGQLAAIGLLSMFAACANSAVMPTAPSAPVVPAVAAPPSAPAPPPVATPAPPPTSPAPSGRIASLRIDATQIRGGDSAVGTVTLVSAAPTGGAVVTLASSDRDVRPPASITITAGSTVGVFLIQTSEPHADTLVRISATEGGETQTTEILLVLPPPITYNDEYRVLQDRTLVVADPGILDNDVRRRGHDLTAVLRLGALSGTVALQANGGFTYQPNAGFSGTDRFTYYAMDGATRSNEATVRIIVLAQEINTPAPAPVPSGPQTLTFTGAQQDFVVPAGVTSITIQASGAQGAKGAEFGGVGGGAGGLGGSVTGTIPVTPGETLIVNVGGQGANGVNGGIGGAGGFNGGGNGGDVVLDDGAGGGGASSVLRGVTRLLIAGGGGGGGGRDVSGGGPGGAGGLLTGGAGGAGIAAGFGNGGGGGTAVGGGAGGTGGLGPDGSAGSAGTGGAGGGAFGGGGGEAPSGGGLVFAGAGGGGGGSSATDAVVTNVTHQQSVRTGNGQITIVW